jgi:hypothetical protein
VESVDDLLTRKEEMITQVKVHFELHKTRWLNLPIKREVKGVFLSGTMYTLSYSNASSNQWFADHHKNYQLSFLDLA